MPLGPESLVLSRDQAQQILDHALREAPLECCGLLIGTENEVRHVVEARNELASATRYRIESRDHFAALRRARAEGLQIIGGYHSHPRSAPEPSATDLTEAWPELFYLIVSLAAEHTAAPLKAWRLAGGNFVEVSLVTSAEDRK
jgi:proteasome lid subunit RPN8/RPN11